MPCLPDIWVLYLSCGKYKILDWSNDFYTTLNLKTKWIFSVQEEWSPAQGSHVNGAQEIVARSSAGGSHRFDIPSIQFPCEPWAGPRKIFSYYVVICRIIQWWIIYKKWKIRIRWCLIGVGVGALRRPCMWMDRIWLHMNQKYKNSKRN